MDHIIVIVGQEEKEFMVHENVICGASEFFKVACSRPWKESTERKVRLPEQPSDSFTMFLHWLYNGELELWEDGEIEQTTEAITGGEVQYVDPAMARAIKCFILGDVLRSAKFCNSIIDATMRVLRDAKVLPPPNILRMYWSMLPQKSTMSRLLVDEMAARANENVLALAADRLPADFILQLALAGARDRRLRLEERKPHYRWKCFYHEHGDEKDRCV